MEYGNPMFTNLWSLRFNISWTGVYKVDIFQYGRLYSILAVYRARIIRWQG